ncbi:MAG TPA: tetratricopeptide repeat protein [Polyangiaceae bacterium]|jgi:tetratricopeptide (TPR) repeat protein
MRLRTLLLLLTLVACGGHAAARRSGPATVALPPANPLAVSRMVQGVQAAKDGQREHAAALLREAIGIDGNLWEARYDLGVVLAGTGDLAGSEEQLATAARLAPDSQDVASALAEVRRRRGEHKLAAEGLADFVHDHPNAVEARTLYAAALRESGQIDKAIGEAKEVLVRKPADASALAELALSHLAKGEKEAAALLAKQALDANPSSAVAHRATGLLDLANGDDAEAFAEFRKASQADPHDTTSRLNMGVVLLKAGAYAKAEEQYREIMKVSPDDVEAQVGLAAAVRGQADAQHPQRLEEARSLLEKVLATSPHDTSALFNLGVLYADFLKRPGDAAPLFKRFLSDASGDNPLRAEAEKYISAAAAVTPPPAAPPPPPGGPPAKGAPGASASPSPPKK